MRQLALLSLVFAVMASNAHAQHPDEALAEPARQFEATLVAVDSPEARQSAVRELLRKFLFAGVVGEGPDGVETVMVFTRSAYALELMDDVTKMRLAEIAGVALAARDRQRGLWVNPGQSSEFYLSPGDLIDAFESNPDLIPPPPPVLQFGRD